MIAPQLRPCKFAVCPACQIGYRNAMATSDIPLKTALESIAADARLMGLDLGTKTIGVATSDRTRTIATPIETIARKKFTADAERIIALAARENIGLILLGLPVNMDGTEGPRAQSTRAFARNFARLSAIPIVFWDERLSTAAVERMLIDADASRARRDEVVDKLAAAWILQAALDSLR
jgi:putative Holliday junction resolvase